jgi:putative CocE/NonD family hydrolase
MYDFFLRLSPLITVNDRLFGGKAAYWQEIIEHTAYDDFWKKRSVWKFMDNVNCAVLNVGGWFDAEDPVGPLLVYRSVERKNPKTVNALVMGPWSHGGWGRGPGESLGNLHFGVKTGEFFREHIQFPFFMKHLKDKGPDLPEAWMFVTGLNEFRRHDAWPPRDVREMTLTLGSGHRLVAGEPRGSGGPAAAADAAGFDEYVSDPNRPVPYVGYIAGGMTRDYMTEDQRFAAQRPDVLVYQTEPLDRDVVIAGPISVSLGVATTGTDADFVVKLIDVYPNDYPTPTASAGQPVPSNAVKMGGYQQLVRGEPFRGKYRRSFERPEPFVPGQRAEIAFEMPDVYHAFRRGHRIMVQIQSSWFPLTDRNPQKFMEIPRAVPADFQKATQRVYHGSSLTVRVLPGS